MANYAKWPDWQGWPRWLDKSFPLDRIRWRTVKQVVIEEENDGPNDNGRATTDPMTIDPTIQMMNDGWQSRWQMVIRITTFTCPSFLTPVSHLPWTFLEQFCLVPVALIFHSSLLHLFLPLPVRLHRSERGGWFRLIDLQPLIRRWQEELSTLQLDNQQRAKTTKLNGAHLQDCSPS